MRTIDPLRESTGPQAVTRNLTRLAAVATVGVLAVTTLALAPAQAATPDVPRPGAANPDLPRPGDLLPGVPTPGVPAPGDPRPVRDLGREVLGVNDGWAAANGGTTGGVAADADHVFTVSTWAEFQAALGGTGARKDTTPRIVYVKGTINAFDAPDGTRLTCGDFEKQVFVGGDPAVPFTMANYIAAYDPAVWGRATDPSGPLEDARVAGAAIQAKQTMQHVGSNVTIIGLGKDARIVGANVRIRDSHNVILRNLTFSDAYDCFPAWTPTDTAQGNWNSAYDNVSVWTSTNVWVSNSTFDDGDHPHSSLPVVFDRAYEVHDGLLDITHSSNYVTVSYNRFENHDKTMLIGSSNTRTADIDTLKVTIHHNLYEGIGQRAPRVRYGQVHVYNNLYVQDLPPARPGQAQPADLFQYYWGVGVESSMYVENNAIRLAKGTPASAVLYNWGGTRLTEKGTFVNGRPTSVEDAYLAAGGTPFTSDAGWTPTFVTKVDRTDRVEAVVRAKAGVGRF